MPWKLFSIFTKRPPGEERPDPLAPVLAELDDLKKQGRRQQMLIEGVKRDLLKAILEQRRPEVAAFCDLADAYFYHSQALANDAGLRAEQREAMAMVWERVDAALALVGLTMIRQTGDIFDAAIHEAVANQSVGAAQLQVVQIVQPGYLFNNLVCKPAKVIVGSSPQPPAG